ncbi:glycosyltransferase family 4 protein [Tepidibacillus sp. LV47]|uniref:glycosyltransferase family 4 protein n=1 Tax=Tepidibacillus sp. LV47 TaxID=3398228 RepID=UPI003AAFB549
MKNQKKNVSIVTANLYTHDGSTVVLGGLERYTRDLAFLLRDLNFDVTIHQFGDRYWQKNYEGFLVKAYPWKQNAEYCVENIMKSDLEKADYVVYMWIGFQTKYKPNSISINHGIWFDEPGLDGKWGINAAKSHVLPALQQLAALVTVDLNFLNFCRSVIPFADNNKMIYIPNYVDTDIFKPQNRQEDGMIEILYPRRYDKYRGIYLMQEIVPELLGRYPNIRFNFAIDQNHKHLIDEWKEWLQKQPNQDRIRYAHYAMDEMPNAYRDADIVVIPSICSEGTSLAALESMAMGKATIATNVGGLSNLILPNVNGKIVNPTVKEVMKAIEEYIHSPEDRKNHGQRASEITKIAFSKKRWEKQWTELILSIFK